MSGAMHALIVAAAGLGGLGVYLMMPRGRATNRTTGMLLAGAALLLLWITWFVSFRDVAISAELLFCLLATLTVVGGVMTITRTSPVSCALWFTSVVIGTAGLFLLQNAQFLAAAIVIVYAGAIIVMFLFVVMMAQQSGTTLYDRLAREPGLAVLAGFVLLIALVSTSLSAYRGDSPALSPSPDVTPVAPSLLLHDSADNPHVASLGTALFTHHWVSLEIAGTLLLVAMVGAILISSRRARN